jgi:uncharacterized membrane protein
MKKIGEFFKTCMLGGLFVLLPVLLFYLAIAEIMDVLILLATPIADLFPESTFDWLGEPMFIAILILVVTCFLLGLSLRSALLTRFGRWFDENVLDRVPIYRGMKMLARGLVGKADDDSFRSGVLMHIDGSAELVYIVENPGNGKVTILLPVAPTGFSGRLKIVDAGKVTLINASLGEVSAVISRWGIGLQDFLKDGAADATGETPRAE